MPTDLKDRKATTFKVVMEDGAPATRQITALLEAVEGDDKDSARHLLQLDKPITIEGTNHTYTALFYASREEDMLKGVTFPVVVTLGIDGKKLRPNAIVNGASVFEIGDTVGFRGETIPMPSDVNVNNGDMGTVTDIDEDLVVHFENQPEDTTVTVKRTEVVAIEGTDTAAPEADELAKKQQVVDGLVKQNATLIRELREMTDRVEKAERALTFEAAETTSPLPTSTVEYEHEIRTGILPATLDKMVNEGWEILHMQFTPTVREGIGADLNVVYRRPKPNGLPIRTTDGALSISTGSTYSVLKDVTETVIVGSAN